jgi:hypothetical protein
MSPDSTALKRAHQLEVMVFDRSGRQIRDLRVFQHEKGLVLRGRASTYYLKQLAQHVAMESTGLPILNNQIDVTAHDRGLAAEPASRFSRDRA